MSAPAARSDVRPLSASDPACTDAVLHGIDEVFVLTSATQSFDDADARRRFHERWLGRYLSHWPDWCFAALKPDGVVAGYIAGCPEDPSRSAKFPDHRYYAMFADACGRYPAHLHIDVRPGFQGAGVGSVLMAAFAARCAEAGIAGLHAVTADGHENNGFFEAQGFHAEARAAWNDRALVFYARNL